MKTRAVEWMLAAMMVSWGMGLLLPPPAFVGDDYRLLLAIGPEEAWGAWSMAIGGIRMLALWINGAWRRTPLFRAGGAVLGVVWWVILFFLFWFGSIDHPRTIVFIFPVCVFFEAVACFRSGFDAHEAGALKSGYRP